MKIGQKLKDEHRTSNVEDGCRFAPRIIDLMARHSGQGWTPVFTGVTTFHETVNVTKPNTEV